METVVWSSKSLPLIFSNMALPLAEHTIDAMNAKLRKYLLTIPKLTTAQQKNVPLLILMMCTGKIWIFGIVGLMNRQIQSAICATGVGGKSMTGNILKLFLRKISLRI